MAIAYLVVTILLAVIMSISGGGKIFRIPQQVHVLHDIIGLPMKVLPLLAALEFAGALGIVAGIWWPLLGIAAGIGLVLYFVGAVVSHLRVGDAKGVGPASFLLCFSASELVLRYLTSRAV